MKDGKRGIAHAVQQHVHAGKVVSGDIFFLSVDHADAVFAHALAYVEQQGPGTAGEIQYTMEIGLLARPRVLAVQGNNAGKNAGNLLRGIEFSGLFS